MTDIRTDIRALRGEMHGLREEMHAGFETGHGEVNGLRGELNAMRTEMHAGFASVRDEMDRRFAVVDRRFDSMDAKMSRLVSIQVGMLLMVASAALAYFFK